MGEELSCYLHRGCVLRQCHEPDIGMEPGRLYECADGNTKPDIALDAEWHHRTRDAKIPLAEQARQRLLKPSAQER